MNAIQEYLKYIFNIDNNTSATVITTLSVILLTLVVNGIAKFISKQIALQTQRKLIKTMLETTSNESLKLSERLLSFTNKLVLKNDREFILTSQAFSHLTTLVNYNVNEVYSATFFMWNSFPNGKRIKAFNTIFKCVRLIFSIEKRIPEDYKFLIEHLIRYNEELNAYLKILFSNSDKLYIEIESITKDDPSLAHFVSDFSKLHRSWDESDDRNNLLGKEKLFLELIELCEKNIIYKEALQIKYILNDCINSIDSVKALFKTNGELLFNFSSILKCRSKQLKMIAENIY